MKKITYIKSIILSVCAVLFSIIIVRDVCLRKLLCNKQYLFVGKVDILEFIAWVSISIFITTLITFFISDKIFKIWLKFTAIYFTITALLVYISPTIAGGTLGLASDKESVSMFMSEAFVIISIIMFLWMRGKESGRR